MKTRSIRRLTICAAIGAAFVFAYTNSSNFFKNQIAHASSVNLYEPSDGHIYFGFTYKFWDDLNDPAWGDTRPFAVRYSDAISSELSNKSPSLFAIPTIWQNADSTMVP